MRGIFQSQMIKSTRSSAASRKSYAALPSLAMNV